MNTTHIKPYAGAITLAAAWAATTITYHHRLNTAQHDPLTHLHTRNTFTRHATRILKRQPAAVLVLDLDGFKPINDTYGHVAGDAVLTHTAARLVNYCGPGTATARLGGDEFAAVMPMPMDKAGIDTHLAALHALLRAPIFAAAADLAVGASIGAYIADRRTPLGDALGAADALMYDAKKKNLGWHVSDAIPPASAGRRWHRTRPASA